MRHRALAWAPVLGRWMCTMIGRKRQSDFGKARRCIMNPSSITAIDKLSLGEPAINAPLLTSQRREPISGAQNVLAQTPPGVEPELLRPPNHRFASHPYHHWV